MSELRKIKEIVELYKYVEEFNGSFYPESKLKPIVGGGCLSNPKVLFVFINPTKRNIASQSSWVGKRVPWVGYTTIWNFFHKADIIHSTLLNEILNYNKNWSVEFTTSVYSELEYSKIGITNIVKWAGEDATLPESEKIKRYLPILKHEIEIIQPDIVVAFGQIPFFYLTGNKLKFKDYYQSVIHNKKCTMYDIQNVNSNTKVIPCYFPVGMGRFHEKEAVKILQVLKQHVGLENRKYISHAQL